MLGLCPSLNTPGTNEAKETGRGTPPPLPSFSKLHRSHCLAHKHPCLWLHLASTNGPPLLYEQLPRSSSLRFAPVSSPAPTPSATHCSVFFSASQASMELWLGSSSPRETFVIVCSWEVLPFARAWSTPTCRLLGGSSCGICYLFLAQIWFLPIALLS